MCETKRPGATSHHYNRDQAEHDSHLRYLGKNEATSYRGIDIRLTHPLVTRETISWGMTLIAARINNHHKEGISLNKLAGGMRSATSWGQGKHVHASRMQVKQGLAEQEMYKDQEWPDSAMAK